MTEQLVLSVGYDMESLTNPMIKSTYRGAVTTDQYGRSSISPYAALSGYDAFIKETARLTDKRMELDESTKIALSDRLQIIVDQIGEHPEIAITYFESEYRLFVQHYSALS